MKKQRVLAFLAILGLASVEAFAGTGVLTAPSFDLTDVGTVAGALLTGLAGYWAINKGLGLAKRG